MDKVAERIAYNRKHNGELFYESTRRRTTKDRLEFQKRLIDAMFSVIEAEDFARICLRISFDMQRKNVGPSN